jgi:RHS repeat-associated protein
MNFKWRLSLLVLLVAVSSTWSFAAAPSITSLSPTSGAVGASVTITGRNFGSPQGSSTVKFNSTTATTITSWSTTSIVAVVPTGATTGNVVVTVGGTASNGVSFTVVPPPSITSLSSTSGVVGASITITGANFGSPQGAGTVKFNGTTATVTSWSATSIVTTVPSAASNGNVIVHASGVDSNGVNFTVIPTPSITSLSPPSGAVGASVTITGTNFGSTQGTSAVKFNTTAATAITSWSATSIVAKVPAGATTGNVVVTVGSIASNGSNFTVVPAPSITSLSTPSGAVGATVTITGTNFGSTQGSGTVKFNGVAATVTTWGASSIKTTVPTGATTGNVVVHASGVDSNGFAFTVFPSISSLSSTSGAVGASVTINGLNFGATGTVKFNTTTATTVTSWSTTSIVATVPAGASTGNVVVTVGGNASNGSSFTVVAAPAIASLSTTSGVVGAPVTINGANFGSPQGTGTISFNGTPATVTTWGASAIQTTVPTGATTGNIVVHASGVDSNGSSFTVFPSISGLSPNSGAVGLSITISGLNFGSPQGSSTVKFNTTAATTITSWGPSSIVATVPAGATTGNVVVTVGGNASNGSSFTVIPTPNITSLSSPSGPVGTPITITGTNFGSTGTVTFNGTTASPSNWNGTTIVVPVPAGATSGNVVVTVNGAASNGVAFTVLPTPTITILSPTSGVAGTSVTISGTNFGVTQGSSTVTFNGALATPASWNAVSIVVPVPGAATTGNVVVTVSGVASSGTSFTVLNTPVISSLSPTAGQVGTSVTIAGINFGTPQGGSTVSFNGTAATPSSWTATSIVVPVPAGATSGPISATVGSQTANSPFFTVGALPAGWLDTDVGAVGLAGSSSYSNGVFTVTGAGLQFSGTADSFHYVYQPLSGDGSIVARVTMPTGTGADAGLMIRGSLDGASAHGTTVYGGTLIQFATRTAPGGTTLYQGSVFATPPYWLKLVRSGSTLSSYASPEGVNWTLLASQTVNMAPNVYIGLVEASGTSSPSLATATFDNVSVSSSAVPAPVISNASATTGAVGSTLTISGSNFGASQSGSVVNLNATPVMINSWSNTSIGITIPSGATSGALVVSVAPSMNDSNPIIFTVTSQPLPTGWLDGDVGAVGNAGNASYANGTFTVKGAGSQNSTTSDAFHFVYQPLSGDGSIVAHLVSMPTGTGTLAGVMIRQSLDPSSANGATEDYSPGGYVIEFNLRTAAGANTTSAGGASGTPPYWIELVRSGSTLSSYTSTDGTTWTLLGNQTIGMAPNVDVGLLVNSGSTSSLATVTFDNVSVNSFAAPAAVITSVSATTGTTGSQVVITGANFGSSQGASLVTLKATPASVNSWSNTSISITIPSGAVSGPLVVSVAPGLNDSNAVMFTVTSQPLPSGWLDADVGAVGVAGNATYNNGTFTVNGAGANSSATDAFHFLYQPLSGDGSIVARVVSMPSGTGALAGVTIRQTLDSTSANGATDNYYPGGAAVTFYARTAEGGSSTSVGNGVGSTIPPYWIKLVRSGNTLSGYASPDGATWSLAGSTTVNMTPDVYVGFLVNSGNLSSTTGVTFDNVTVSLSSQIPAPTIVSLSPNTAVPTAYVTVAGANFGGSQGTSTVTFNGTAGSPANWNANRIDVPVPSGATTGSVVVTVGGVASNGMPFTVSNSPSITSLSAASGTVGTTVTITGVNFGSTQGTSTITFNGTAGTPTNWSATSITVPVPTGATSGNVTVTVGGVASNALPFSILQMPSITSLSTTSATIGASVTINGTNFGATQGASTVTFNGTGGTPTSWSNTSIVVPVPLGATTGSVVVTVSGVSSNPVALTINLVSLPAVVQVQPANGSTGVPENGRIIVRFAQPVQPAAVVSGTVSVSRGTNGMVGTLALSNDGLSVTFTPALIMQANTVYTVAVTNVTGNQTAPEFQSSFTTGSTTDSVAPTVVHTSPQAYQSGVPISSPIVMQFSKPMDPATFTVQNFTLTDYVTGILVPGMIQVDPTGTTASFVPQGFLGVGRTFGVTVNSLTQDSSGNNLNTSGASFTFTTSFAADTTAPQVLGMSPANGATAVPQNAVIVLEFSKPLNVITVSSGLQVQSGGQQVPGAIALSNSNQQVTFTPQGGLAANTTYTIVTTSQITDVGGLALANPGSFSFTTSAVTDTTTPSVTSVSPSNYESGVPINAFVQVRFSKPVDPWTVTPSAFQITFGTNETLTGTVSASTDGLTATFTPSGPLNSFTTYYLLVTGGITDVEGHPLSYFGSNFTTGSVTDASAPTVLTVSPANGTNSVPVNVRVDLLMSAPVSAASVGSSALVVASGGTSVPGTISVSSNGTVVTFVPTNLLAVSTTYSLTASGFVDQAGNAVVPFTSSFTTGTSGTANTTLPTVVSVSPLNYATSVSVNGPVVLTFNEAIDPTSVNNVTVPISVNGLSGVLAGNYIVDGTGKIVTFTPLAPLPGNSTIFVQVATSGVLDLSGNRSNSFFSTFTTGAASDNTAPVVTMVTPQNGSSGVGPNAQVVLTFSESLNPSTVNSNNFALLTNGSALGTGTGVTVSADNRVITLSGSLPVSSTITVLATGGVTDLSGNALANFQSQFTTAPSLTAPSVVSQRPGNGATGAPLNASIVLYFNEAMNASSVQSALEVSQNGALVSGTVSVIDNGQVLQFTPATQWQPGALIQVFVTSTTQSVSGYTLNNYQSSFTTAPNTSATAPVLVSTNPANQVTGVPTNVVIGFSFNEPLDPTALLADTVTCSQNGIWFQIGVSLLNGGTLLQVAPRQPLAPNTATRCQLGTGIQGTNGLALSALSANALSFTTGAGADTVMLTATSTSPPNGSTNVGDNADVRLVFNKPINPLTLNASTVTLSGGGVTVVPDSISFINNNQSALLVPHTPLPDGTQMTLTVSGVTDVAGNALPAQTTQFTTGTGPDVVPPAIVLATPFQNAQNVPLNTVVQLQMSEPVDPGTVSSRTLTLVNNSNGQIVTGTYSVSADGLTITFVPSGSLAANTGYYVNFPGAGFGSGIADLAGNSLPGTSPITFTTGATTSTNAPQVIGVSPANGTTAVPINAQVVVQFNEPVDASSIGGVSLAGTRGTVNASKTLSNGNQRLILVPAVPLSSGTTYTVTVAGVQDMSGNVLASPVTASFTTGSTADLTPARVVTVSPASNATGVAATAAVTVTFSKNIDPLTVTTGTMQLIPTSTSIPVAGTVSSNGGSATFTPNQPLDLLTQYYLQLTSGITDMEGQSLSGGAYNSYFTTGQGTEGGPPSIASVVQASGVAGTPVVISGAYFGTSQGGSTIAFNGTAATPTGWSDTQIHVPVPTGATSGSVVVTVNGVPSNGFKFNVNATPTVTGISPGTGAAGTVVTLTGTNLGDTSDSVQVAFGGAPVTAAGQNETSLTATVPANAPPGNASVTVNVNGYYSSGISFTVIATPSISLVNPNSGVSGTPVNLSGNNFGSSQGSSTVTFNGVPAASITSWGSTFITAVPASNVTTGPVVVVVNSVPSTSTNNVFTVTNPAIGSVVPPAGASGSIVTINGSGFQLSANQTIQVLFNGASYTPNQFTSTSVLAQVPSGASSGPVTVVVGGVTSNSVNFTVNQPPTVTSVSPFTGPAGSDGNPVPITISGAGFGAVQNTSTVNFFGSNTAPSIISWSDSSISLWTPPDAATGPLYVQVAGLNAFAPSGFHVNTVTKLTDSLGNQSQYNLTAQGGVWFSTSSQGPGCSSCTMRGNLSNTPDANGNTLSTTDDSGNVTTYTYDANNNLATVSKVLDATHTATTTYTYNNFGEVLTSIDPLGNKTTNTYDPKGNLLTVTAPAPDANTPASVTQFQYNGLGELTQITDPKQNVTKLTYTTPGLIATITDAQQHVTTYGYDARGNRISVIDPINGSAHPTTFAYDLMNRLTGITYPDGSTVGFTYDSRGRRITSTDQNNKTTTYTYDDADRLTAVTDPANNNTQYAYDTEDNLLSITDANNHTTSFAYNARGWVTGTTFPSTFSESYTYDLVGNLLSKTDRKNQTIQYVYDALYRLSSKTYPDTTNVEYTYDLVGKIKSVTDPTGVYGFAYDNMGRLISTTTNYTFVPGTYTNAYSYDAASNRQSLTAPDTSITTYGYDTLNRLNGMANSWAGSFGFGYDALSRRTQLTRPNGITTNYNYDSLSHLLSVLHQAGTNVLDGASYTYEPAGNRTTKGNYLNGVTSNYTYDPLYQLTQVTQGGSTTETYSYDFVGDRLSSSGVPNYNYNSSNELTSNSSGSYTYDANGNTLTDASGRSYTWDFENRLTQAVVTGTGTVTFKYDPFGRRIQKSGPLGTTNYLYDRFNLLQEIDSTGSLLARYTHGPNIDEPLAEVRSGTISYYQADGVGSITSLTTPSATAGGSYSYDTFGNLSASTGSLTNPFRYTGREFDSETGVYYYRARYYDPSVGRFLSEDLIRFRSGINFYDYVKNNPVLRLDPTGLIHQAWSEPPFDGRLHDDPGAGLEVLCTKGRNIAQDTEWLEHSIFVRSVEIDALGKDADAGHIDRRDAEIEILVHCREECDKDKKPEPSPEDQGYWERFFQRWKEHPLWALP